MQLSLIQHQFLRSKFWWNPLPSTQYFIKGGTFSSSIYIMITDFNRVWICRSSFKQIVKEKEIYNKMIEIEEKELLGLLGSKVEKYVDGGVYSCGVKEGRLEFGLKVYMKIYLFNWKFELVEADVNVGRLVREDLVQPLMMALTVAESRVEAAEKELGEKGRKELRDTGRWGKFVGERKEKGEINVSRIGGWSKKLLDQILVQNNKGDKEEGLKCQSEERTKDKGYMLMSPSLPVVKEESTQSTIKASQPVTEKKQRSIEKMISRRSESVERPKKKKHKFL